MKGSYVLLTNLKNHRDIRVGSLGTLHFSAGYYCYVGSARGPGGIEARVKRHLKKEKKLRWHIDYLLEHSEVEEVFIKEDGNEIETARQLSKIFEGIPGFGASDSPLSSHLFRCEKEKLMDFLSSHRFHLFP